MPIEQVMKVTSLSKSTIYRIRQVAKERGYDPIVDSVYKDEYFKEASKSGRPKICDEETQHTILGYVEADRAGQESGM